MTKLTGQITLVCMLLAGCRLAPQEVPPRSASPAPDPLPVQQLRAYGEAATGLFVSLADFEDSPAGPGRRQIRQFTIVRRPGLPSDHPTDPNAPAAAKPERKFVVNITRTGAAAMEVTLPVGSELVFTLPYPRDFSRHTLLSLAVYLEMIRDDLEVTLVSDAGRWRCHPALLEAGWNNVLLDIRELRSAARFDAKAVRQIRIGFAHAGGPVTFNLDDVLLIDNRRRLEPAPAGVTATVSGLDYTISLPGWSRRFVLGRADDGLWRLGDDQTVIELAPPGHRLTGRAERTELMGGRRTGQVELIECNPIRLRLASTWRFPARSGEWASPATRQIRWEYTFYGDGRWVAHVEVNNAGGREIGSVRLSPPAEAVWSDGTTGEISVEPFAGPVGRWSYLMAPPGPQQEPMQRAYVDPPAVTAHLSAQPPDGAEDTPPAAFDASQGCYILAARGGRCRFTVRPSPAGAAWPVFRVAGAWAGPVSVTCAGAAIRNVAALADGSILFALPGPIATPLSVEVIGPRAPAALPSPHAAIGRLP